MRVNVGYSCDLEDVQEEIASFLERVSSKLTDAATQTNVAAEMLVAEKYDPRGILVHIHAIRVELNKLDLRLEDTVTIIAGYENAKIEAAQAAAAAEVAEEGAAEVAEEGAALQAVENLAEEPTRVKGPASSSKKTKRGHKKRGKN